MRISFLFLLSLLILPLNAEAARFYFDAPEESSARVSIPVRIDTEGETLNAFEGTVNVTGFDVRVIRAEDAGSVITVWLEHPEAKSTIRFSGITPGGFNGTGTLFQVVAEGGGTATLSYAGVKAYKNDGEGTVTETRVEKVSFDFGEGPAEEVPDTVSPEPFSASLIHTPDGFDEKKVLVFSAHDKGKGIQRYEVCEGGFSCVTSASPHVIADQGQGVFVVRAYDFDGNSRTAFLFTDSAKVVYGTLILALILILGVGGYLLRRRFYAR